MLEEVRKAATARFEALDRRHKGILTRTQLAGVLTFQQFREANADKQGALDLNEFLSVVEKLFRCDTADGFPVEVDGWDMAGIVDDTSGMIAWEASNARSGYRVRLRDGKWHDVPNFALVDPKPTSLVMRWCGYCHPGACRFNASFLGRAAEVSPDLYTLRN